MQGNYIKPCGVKAYSVAMQDVPCNENATHDINMDLLSYTDQV